MNKDQGYYSLVQYSEYPERDEFVNIGVVLFSESAPCVVARFASNPKRIKSVFGVNLGSHFEDIRLSLESRLGGEFGVNWRKENLEHFIAMRSGKVRMSRLRSVHVEDHKKTINSLFEQLVSDVPQTVRPERAEATLKRELQSLAVEHLLEKPRPIELPQGVTVKAPYAYQNGRYNLIRPLPLHDEPSHIMPTAAASAINGKWLYESTTITHPCRLIIVGITNGQQPDFVRALAETMTEHRVGFYRLDELMELAEDIKRNVIKNERPFASP